MLRLVSPNGVPVDAHDDAVPKLLASGFKRAEAEFKAEKPKAATRKRTVKQKE